MKRLVLINILVLFTGLCVMAQNAPKKFQYNYQNYEVLPGDLEELYQWEDAKKACANLTAFGKSDWYLPNKAELDALYRRKSSIGGFATGNSIDYWSSTDSGESTAWGQRFKDCRPNFGDEGQMSITFKGAYCSVRCVRKY